MTEQSKTPPAGFDPSNSGMAADAPHAVCQPDELKLPAKAQGPDVARVLIRVVSALFKATLSNEAVLECRYFELRLMEPGGWTLVHVPGQDSWIRDHPNAQELSVKVGGTLRMPKSPSVMMTMPLVADAHGWPQIDNENIVLVGPEEWDVPVDTDPPDAVEAPYGYCPICRHAGVQRERSPDGFTTCRLGHKYKSSVALATGIDLEGED